MMSYKRSTCQEAVLWVRNHLGKNCFTPFTGQDWQAYSAWVHLLELYFRADAYGQKQAMKAMFAVLSAMQQSCWPVAKATIPAIGDWQDEDRIWNELYPTIPFAENE